MDISEHMGNERARNWKAPDWRWQSVREGRFHPSKQADTRGDPDLDLLTRLYTDLMDADCSESAIMGRYPDGYLALLLFCLDEPESMRWLLEMMIVGGCDDGRIADLLHGEWPLEVIRLFRKFFFDPGDQLADEEYFRAMILEPAECRERCDSRLCVGDVAAKLNVYAGWDVAPYFPRFVEERLPYEIEYWRRLSRAPFLKRCRRVLRNRGPASPIPGEPGFPASGAMISWDASYA